MTRLTKQFRVLSLPLRGVENYVNYLALNRCYGQRYGQRYVTSALQLLPGNLVNLQIKEKLSITSVSEDVKSRLLDEIAKESGHRLEILRLECTPEIEKQENEEEEKKVMDQIRVHRVNGSNSDSLIVKTKRE